VNEGDASVNEGDTTVNSKVHGKDATHQ